MAGGSGRHRTDAQERLRQIDRGQGSLAAGPRSINCLATRRRPEPIWTKRLKRPDSIEAMELRDFGGRKDYPRRSRISKACEKIAPKNPDLLTQLGLLYEANKQPRKAIERYSDALAVLPDQFLALRGRADAYLNVGKHAEAVADYDAAVKLKEDDDNVSTTLRGCSRLRRTTMSATASGRLSSALRRRSSPIIRSRTFSAPSRPATRSRAILTRPAGRRKRSSWGDEDTEPSAAQEGVGELREKEAMAEKQVTEESNGSSRRTSEPPRTIQQRWRSSAAKDSKSRKND